MFALVPVQINKFHGLRRRRQGRLPDLARRPDKCDDGSVMVLVRLHIQEGHSRDRPDSLRNSLDNFLPSTLAKVWNTLYELQFCDRISPPQSGFKTLGRAKVSPSSHKEP